MIAQELQGEPTRLQRRAQPEEGRRLYEHFAAQVSSHGVGTATGCFGAEMKVTLVNDGPVTIWLDTATR